MCFIAPTGLSTPDELLLHSEMKKAQVSCLLSSTQGTPADVLYKGTITRLITEDSASRAERERDEALTKSHVVFEGISGHILTYDREYIRISHNCPKFYCPPSQS